MKLVVFSALAVSVVSGYAFAGGARSPEGGLPRIVPRLLA